MAGLVPAIHAFKRIGKQGVDARHKAGHDVEGSVPGLVQDKVAIVTGPAGIGRAIAMLMAQEGAKVLVNDVGAALDGSGGDAWPAQQVVDEIKRNAATPSPRHCRSASRRTPTRSCRRRSTPSAGSTSWSTTPASCATRFFTA